MIKSFSATERVIFGVLVAVLIVTSIILAATVNEAFLHPVPTLGGQLDEGVVGLPHLVNPVLAFSDADRDLTALIYSGLMKYDNGAFVPDLAQSYTISPDGLTYTFTLKKSLTFQDGSPLTADDVVFTIGEIENANLKSPRRADWADVTVTKLSDTQVQFTLKQPYAPFLSNLTVGIIPEHIWKNVSTDEFIFSQYNVEPIGSGPYRLESIQRDSGGIPVSYTLTPWNKYIAGEAYVAHLVLHFFPDEKTAVEAFSENIIESLSTVSPVDAAKIASTTPNVHIITSTLPRIFGVFFNQNTNPVFANLEVRQALNMTVDKNLIVNQVLDGYGVAINSPIPVGTLPSTKLAPPDVAAARAILEKAGWTLNPQGIFEKKTKTGTTTLTFSISTSDSPDLTATADILKNEWTALGAKVDVKVFEVGDLNQNVITPRNYDALLFGESVGKDPDLYAFWHSSERNAPGLNISMYVNAQADKLLENARAASSTDVRLAQYAAFNQIIQTDIPAVFLYSPDFIYIVPDKIKGMKEGPVTEPSDRWSNVSTWYIDTDNIWKVFVKDKN